MTLSRTARNGSGRSPRGRRPARSTPTSTGPLVTDLPGGALAAPTARRVVKSLAPAMSKDCLDDARLVVSELVNNSVEHGGGGPGGVVRLAIDLSDGIVKVVVSDSGPGFVPPACLAFGDDLEATSGRGLRILEALADRWGVTNGDGTHVWFEMNATRSH
jgi:anti-sigma regulatory factor (Ser/Thr protein kinase)